MKMALRLLLAAMLAFTLVACKKEEVKPVEEPTPPPVVEKVVEPVIAPLDAQDYTDPRNLDNPESILSKNVIYFEFDKSVVLPEYQSLVSAHAEYLAAHASARSTLEGHADERGTREYNLGLGERRGNAVNGLLSAQGGRGSQLSVVSYGEERPTCRESSESCWGNNRRVEIVYTAR